MRLIRSARAQSTAEYAVLFAIVIGAAVAMQQYISARLRGAMQLGMNNYTNQANTLFGGSVSPFLALKRTSNSNSNANFNMDGANKGNVNVNTNASSTQTK